MKSDILKIYVITFELSTIIFGNQVTVSFEIIEQMNRKQP